MILGRYQVFRTTDPAEAFEGALQTRPWIRNIRLNMPGHWRFAVNRVQLGSLAISATDALGAAYELGEPPGIRLVAMLSGQITISVGDVTRACGRLASFQPIEREAVSTGAVQLVQFDLTRACLTRSLHALECEADVDAYLHRAWLTQSPESAALDSTLRYIVHHIDSYGLPEHPGAGAQAFEDLVYAHAAQMIAGGAGGRREADNPLAFQRCINFIDANIGGELPVLDIASAAGLSLRSVQLLFQRHAGTTITEFVRQQRLARARELLSAIDGYETVLSVALAVGFNHLSYFTRAYKAAFGELPSETLRHTR